MLSDKVKELIKKSRIVSFESWQNYPPEVIAIFQQADDAGKYLTDEEIAKIKTLVPSLSGGLSQGKVLRDNVNEIVFQARAVVLDANPNILEPGGGLYPPPRAEACWRDFWHFLRCISYGVGGQSINYTSDRGLGYMEQLYRELQVPLDAMVLGLEQLKVFSLREFASDRQEDLKPYFDRLIESMRNFSPVS
ncbi:phycobilisome protein [Waterburya agarophytonicola K14]|uniref:Phycobilisome protein n=1 Tax=Waterburya agarophytonicola KI4 TaxID=2874699 RepID=A0A964BV70_9CYAN|nr:phycobilisome protein [Waterburya agarophytonicola]MCC0179346.1 phycobilisome protein [Waterburya agarophytonicola KI4]